MNIDALDPDTLSERAFELALQFSRPNTYDANYLALAEHEQCVFWTGDERLYHAVSSSSANLKWLGSQPEA